MFEINGWFVSLGSLFFVACSWWTRMVLSCNHNILKLLFSIVPLVKNKKYIKSGYIIVFIIKKCYNPYTPKIPYCPRNSSEDQANNNMGSSQGNRDLTFCFSSDTFHSAFPILSTRYPDPREFWSTRLFVMIKAGPGSYCFFFRKGYSQTSS